MVDEVNGVQLLYRNAKKSKRSIKKLDYILTGSCKMVWIVNTLILVLAYKAFAGPVQISAFPGGEAAGKYTLDGQGRDVYCVTNLNDAGPGSLRYDIESTKGPRTIVFEGWCPPC